ncbi:MAG: 5-formyltetrahydrofolate cyclo-ligase [Desulfobulbaceae bacterium]|nr:5-formyltetrahydrofolate cyclo-ligase [Desulfobulbaceae bacterium]
MIQATNAKAKLRKRGLLARRVLDNQTRVNASQIISEHIVHSHEFMACKTIACYLPSFDEVDPSYIIERAWRANKRIFAPVVADKYGMFFRQLLPDTRLEKNRFDLWESVSGPGIRPEQIDVVITPVVAFDDQQNRIGMGGGYFDRCFSFLRHRRHWLHPKLIGVAFDCQKVEKIPANPWDIRLYSVITETR